VSARTEKLFYIDSEFVEEHGEVDLLSFAIVTDDERDRAMEALFGSERTPSSPTCSTSAASI
jgi:hypothetical protein